MPAQFPIIFGIADMPDVREKYVAAGQSLTGGPA